MNADLQLTPSFYPSNSVQPRAGVAPSRTSSSRSALWCRVGKGIEWGGTAAAAVAGGLTFSGLHLFGLIPDTLIGALLVGLLASALIGLTGLLWKLAGLLIIGAGKLTSRIWGTARGEKLLRAGVFVRRIRGDVFGAVLAPFALVLIDRTGLPGLNGMKLTAPGELLVPFVLTSGALLGAALSGLVRPRVKWLLLAGAVLANLAPLSWLLYRGYDNYLFRPDVAAVASLPVLSIENPGSAGPYHVQSLSYGSGHDRHRPEYGRDVSLITSSVNAQPAWKGYSGVIGAFYKWWYGFDTTALPLNGLVWRPAGAGPFPLVLIVHGNHTAGDYSDPGYAYLGEHLASRGFIAASVDQNFLNGWFFYDGEGEEMPVRAWLLLKHLQEWRKWNADPANPFYGQVDLARVALMGHSRGGEAATHAASMNKKFYYPIDQVAQKGEFGFGIKAVVGIAPPDAQYRPGGRAETLKDVSYLALYGGHDQDLWWAAPFQQYNRVEFEGNPRAFKAAAYIYRANHGQFNTVWGDADQGEIGSLMLNRKPLLAAEQQRIAGKVFMTAFLEAALMGKDDYRAVFQSPASARAWLPEDVIITGYEDATFRAVNTNQRLTKQDGIDAVQGRSKAQGLTTARRETLPLRNGENQGNNVMFLQWEPGNSPSYTLELPTRRDAPIRIDSEDSVTFTLATAMDDATPVEITVQLRDADGTRVSLPLSRFGVIHPPVAAHMLKSQPLSELLNAEDFEEMRTPYERVMQTYMLPLHAFLAVDTGLDVTNIAAIRFEMNGARAGRIYLDQVGFAN
jgi:dienelactone hydrolase